MSIKKNVFNYNFIKLLIIYLIHFLINFNTINFFKFIENKTIGKIN